MYEVIIGLPGVSCILAGVMGRRLGERGVSWITSGCIVTGGILAIIGWGEVVIRGGEVSIELWRWVGGLGRGEIEWGIWLDGISMTMIMVVLTVSSMVHIYSNWYMSEEGNRVRYLMLLSMFTWMMVIMLAADNYIMMFVGWEGMVMP